MLRNLSSLLLTNLREMKSFILMCAVLFAATQAGAGIASGAANYLSAVFFAAAGVMLLQAAVSIPAEAFSAFGLRRRWCVVSSAGLGAGLSMLVIALQAWWLPARWNLALLLLLLASCAAVTWIVARRTGQGRSVTMPCQHRVTQTLASTAWLRTAVVAVVAIATARGFVTWRPNYAAAAWAFAAICTGMAASPLFGSQQLSMWQAFGRSRRSWVVRQGAVLPVIAAAAVAIAWLAGQKWPAAAIVFCCSLGAWSLTLNERNPAMSGVIVFPAVALTTVLEDGKAHGFGAFVGALMAAGVVLFAVLLPMRGKTLARPAPTRR